MSQTASVQRADSPLTPGADQVPPRARAISTTWLVGACLLTGFAVAWVALGIWDPFGRDAAQAQPIVIAATDTSEAASSEGRAPHQIIASPPDGFVINSIDVQAAEPTRALHTYTLFADEGSNIVSGRWIAFDIHRLDAASVVSFSTAEEMRSYTDGDVDTETITVGANSALRATTADGYDVIVFSPFGASALAMLSRGLTPAAAESIAEAVSVRADGTFVLAPSVAALLPPALVGGSAPRSFPSSLVFGAHSSTTVVAYRADDGPGIVFLNGPTSFDEPLHGLSFLLDDVRHITIHGLPAVAGQPADGSGEDTSYNIVCWREHGSTLILAGPVAIDELVAAAESVRSATDAEWGELLFEVHAAEQFGSATTEPGSG